MLYVNDNDGTFMYLVTNNQGLCLVYTSDGYTARIVDSFSSKKNFSPDLRVNVGGDPGTRNNLTPRIFHHVRRYRY
jgi:hypothetical protein